MLYFSSDGYLERNSSPDVSDICFGWWVSDLVETIPKSLQNDLHRKPENDSGVSSEQKNSPDNISITSETKIHYKINNISIESPSEVLDGNLTPEGHVKYKNYRILAPTQIPIRMYSPSGDINTTPIKQKIVPKFKQMEPQPFVEKITALIDTEMVGALQMEQILNPSTPNRRKLQDIRNRNSKLEMYGSSTNISISDRFSTPKRYSRISTAMDIWSPPYERGAASTPDFSNQPMSLQEELLMSSNDSTEYQQFSSPIRFAYDSPAKLSCYSDQNGNDRSANIKNFYKNYNDNTINNYCCKETYKLLETISELHDDIRSFSSEIADIREKFQEDDLHTRRLVQYVQQLSRDLRDMHYLDDIIHLLEGNLKLLAPKKWPFKLANKDLTEFTNLII